MTTAQGPRDSAVTEPQQVLLLHRANFSTRKIAALLNLSQATVSRRLREATEAEISVRWRGIWRTVMFTLLTLSAVTAAAAVASMAWG